MLPATVAASAVPNKSNVHCPVEAAINQLASTVTRHVHDLGHRSFAAAVLRVWNVLPALLQLVYTLQFRSHT